MATQQFTYISYLNYDAGTGTATTTGEGGSRDWTIDSGADDVLQPGDPVTLQGPTPGDTLQTFYVGQTAEGIVVQGGDYAQPVLLSGGPPASPMSVAADPHVICFLSGTMIATPYGEVAVETLNPGDLVLTAAGGIAPVKWLLRQTVSPVFADPMRVAPVRIRAGALGDGLPRRDLRLSADHALLLDGLLVHAGAMVNAHTIQREPLPREPFSYWHVELHGHQLILAEGVAAETFVDNVSRRSFDNWRDYEAVHGGDAAMIDELALPRVKSARQLAPELQDRLGLRRVA